MKKQKKKLKIIVRETFVLRFNKYSLVLPQILSKGDLEVIQVNQKKIVKKMVKKMFKSKEERKNYLRGKYEKRIAEKRREFSLDWDVAFSIGKSQIFISAGVDFDPIGPYGFCPIDGNLLHFEIFDKIEVLYEGNEYKIIWENLEKLVDLKKKLSEAEEKLAKITGEVEKSFMIDDSDDYYANWDCMVEGICGVEAIISPNGEIEAKLRKQKIEAQVEGH